MRLKAHLLLQSGLFATGLSRENAVNLHYATAADGNLVKDQVSGGSACYDIMTRIQRVLRGCPPVMQCMHGQYNTMSCIQDTDKQADKSRRFYPAWKYR